VPEYDCSTCIGTQIGYVTLTGSEGFDYPYTFTESVTIPTGIFEAGDYLLKAAVPYLVGVSFPRVELAMMFLATQVENCTSANVR
jgi:hypothetical protein